MGLTCDAKLMFGFVLDEDEVEQIQYGPDGDDFDWEDWYAKKLGARPPEVEYSDETRDQYHLYWDKKRALAQASGIEVVYCVSFDYPTFVVCALETDAYYGDVQEVDLQEMLRASGEYPAERLKNWCDVTGVRYRQPVWLLSSLYGT